MRFSERLGITPVRVDLQRGEMDLALRNKLWSALHVVLFANTDSILKIHRLDPNLFAQRIWIHHFREPVDQAPRYGIEEFSKTVRPRFFKMEWHQVYDFIEAVAAELSIDFQGKFLSLVNSFLQSENSAYRFIGTQITEITSAEEISGIESALRDAEPLAGVREHLKAALAKFSDRQNPDYRNSIKESISAVEALCKLITGDKSATLGKAVKRLTDAGLAIHPSLEHGWSKLYGYTSDQGGIRHALSDSSNVSMADAKYMLVTCSAFVSYLLESSRVAGIALRVP